MAEIETLEYYKIKLDYRNPRISEFGFDAKSKDQQILSILWEEMAVNELMLSIVSNGFWQYEPLIVIAEKDEFVVLEGNRRLAAVKLLHDNSGIKIPENIRSKITKKLLDQTKKLPVIKVASREDAWKFIGFKHVNGPAKWGGYGKARYIAEIHNLYNVAIGDIAYQIGDSNKTAQKLYQSLMALEQAKETGVYDYEDIYYSRIYFSHLYIGLQRDGIRKFLGVDSFDEEKKQPVPADNLDKLGTLLLWLFGSKISDIRPIIKSQNPDLAHLDQILKNREATLALKDGESLEYSYELSRSNDALFEENLAMAKRGLQKARAYLTTGYRGEEEMLKVAGSVAELADDLYEEMHKVNKEKSIQKRKKRITE